VDRDGIDDQSADQPAVQRILDRAATSSLA
jgi:hypothetical protein